MNEEQSGESVASSKSSDQASNSSNSGTTEIIEKVGSTGSELQSVNDSNNTANSSSELTPVGEPGTVDDNSKLSKNQIKRLVKKQRWEDSKIHRRQKTRRKAKELKEKIKKGLIPPTDSLSRKQKKSNLMENSACKVAVAIDMSFDHLMIEKVTLFSSVIVKIK